MRAGGSFTVGDEMTKRFVVKVTADLRMPGMIILPGAKLSYAREGNAAYLVNRGKAEHVVSGAKKKRKTGVDDVAGQRDRQPAR